MLLLLLPLPPPQPLSGVIESRSSSLGSSAGHSTCIVQLSYQGKVSTILQWVHYTCLNTIDQQILKRFALICQVNNNIISRRPCQVEDVDFNLLILICRIPLYRRLLKGLVHSYKQRYIDMLSIKLCIIILLDVHYCT